MTTEIATRQDAPLTFTPTPAEAIHAALEQWAGGMAVSVRGAEYIVDTPMCPDSFWPLPAGVTTCKAPKQRIGNEDQESYLARRQVAAYTLGAVVRYGLQLGLPPEVAVQGIFTIGGRMSMYAEQMVALIKSQGHGHRVVERSRERCIVEVCRRGTDDWKAFEFTFVDAVEAGYVPNQGPNDKDHGRWPSGEAKKSPGNAKYLTDPAAMLYARVSSIACRTEFPDVLRGLTSYEDMQDEQSAAPITVEATVTDAPARTTAAAILARAEQPAPPAPEPAPVDDGSVTYQHVTGATVTVPPPAPAATPPATPSAPSGDGVERYVLPISKARLDLIATRFAQLNLGGRSNAARDGRLAVTSHIVEREITEPRQLTNDEAKLILDHLAGDAGARLVDQVLNRAQATETPAEPAEQPAAPADDEDPYTNLDPTVEAAWAGDEAAGDGQ